MKETFTNRAKKALQNAQNEAKLLRHRTVGTEHLLLGLITEQDGIAGKTLRETSLTAEDVRDEIEHLVDYGPMSKNDDFTHEDVILPYSPRSRQVMAYAADEARRLNSPLVVTEHIVLGLLRDENILSSQIMKNLNLSLSQVRQNVSKKLGISYNSDSLKSRNKTNKKRMRSEERRVGKEDRSRMKAKQKEKEKEKRKAKT